METLLHQAGDDREQKGAGGLGDGGQVPPPGPAAQRAPAEGGNVHDAIKTFNVYGYGMCCCASANIAALGRYAGLPARGRIINAHSVPELFWDGAWRLLDASLINYFPKADGKLAGVDEIMAGAEGVVRPAPGAEGQRRGAAEVHARAAAGRTAPRSFGTAPSTTRTAGSRPRPTAGTPPCRSTTAPPPASTSTATPRATRSTSSSARASG